MRYSRGKWGDLEGVVDLGESSADVMDATDMRFARIRLSLSNRLRSDGTMVSSHVGSAKCAVAVKAI